MNYDYEIEKAGHPENFEDNSYLEEGGDLVDLVTDSISDLAKYSVNNDDCFNKQVEDIYQAIEEMKEILKTL